jgi:hypothetical protein
MKKEVKQNLKKVAAGGAALAVGLSATFVGYNSLPDPVKYKIGNKKLSQQEFNNQKADIANQMQDKIENMKRNDPSTHCDFFDPDGICKKYIQTANIQAALCDKKLIAKDKVTTKKIIQEANNLILNGC